METIDSVLAQDYPTSCFEVIIADGASSDGTDSIIKEYANTNFQVKYIHNAKKIVPTGLNLAIAQAQGNIIIRMDAHSIYPKNYISKLVEALEMHQADNVGCVIKTIPSSTSSKAKAIAIGLSSSFGVGNSMFRVGVDKPMEVDTVPFGCFRKEVFEKIGLFDEELVRNQDDEFNARMIKNGYRIVLIPDLECSYMARNSFGKLSRMLFQYGLFKPLVNFKLKHVATIRQLIPLLLVLYIILGFMFSFAHEILLYLYLMGLTVYLVFNMLSSMVAAVKSKSIVLFPLLAFTYPLMHISYGIGYLNGFWRIINRNKANSREVQLSR